MKKSLRFGLVISPKEKAAVERLAEVEGGLSQAALIRLLVRKAAHLRGLWPPADHNSKTTGQDQAGGELQHETLLCRSDHATAVLREGAQTSSGCGLSHPPDVQCWAAEAT